MNNIANKTSLWQFLDNTSVVIPILQRDYAQGRTGYESLREKFLLSIHSALDHPEKQLKLDFVYGSADQQGRFNPLDGQQRLTTLWLLHWYIAYKLGKLNDEVVKKHLINFTYETRTSSSQFCYQLVNRGNELKQNPNENIAEAIMRQTWVPSVWRQDPTVQSILRMLSGEQNDKTDGIEELFSSNENQLCNYWNLLTSPAATCPIVFYELDLENLGQSDDLYVKMNGRGKPLSDFENFKADLIKYITDMGWSSFLDAKKGLPILMDTTWTDFFWKYRNNSISLDDMFMGFVNRYFLVKLMITHPKQKIEDKELGNSSLDRVFSYLYSYTENEEKRISYSKVGFGIYQDLFKFENCGAFSLLYDLRTVLNNVCLFDRQILTECIRNRFEDNIFEFIYTSKKNNYYLLTQPETIAFWAVCRFFESPTSYCKLDNLKHWMRIVWNVCGYTLYANGNVRPEIRSKTALRSAILQLNKAFPSMRDLYDTSEFSIIDNSNPDADQNVIKHIIEEQEKIKKFNEGIYNGSLAELIGKSWESIIVKEEELPVFNGTIRALFYNQDGIADWSYFDIKYKNLHWYLNNDNDLDETAYRNYLLFDFDRSHNFWYPEGEKRKALWRLMLAYNHSTIHSWLISQPKDDNALKNVRNIGESYARRSLIQTSLVSEITHKDGMYLTHSWLYGCDVFIHHQLSSPYVIFNEDRNNILKEAFEKGYITISSTIIKPCGLIDARDVVFVYNDEEYNWHAKGVIYKQDNPEKQIKQENTLTKFLEILSSLNQNT